MKYKTNFSDSDLMQMEKDFKEFEKERWGGPIEKHIPKKFNAKKGSAFTENMAQTFSEIYIIDSAKKILANDFATDDLRAAFFYNKAELDKFKQLYKNIGGNVEELRIRTITRKDCADEFLCYQVSKDTDYYYVK